MRRLPPVYSPLSLSAIAAAIGGALRGGSDPQDRLTQYLGERFDAERVLLTGSGTQALQLAMGCAPSFEGDAAIVALPAYSCFDLVSAAVGAGVRVRFYDIDPKTLSPDMDSLREALRRGVSAVVAGSLYGYPIEWDKVRYECRARGTLLIEDAAQGVGTRSGYDFGGSVGDMTILSFGRGKGWTGGGGGALLLRDNSALEATRLRVGRSSMVRGLRTAAITLAAWTFGRPLLYGIPAAFPQLGLGETRYHPPADPARISAFSASLAKAMASEALDAAETRRERWETWSGAFAKGDPGGDQIDMCRPIGGVTDATFLRCAVLVCCVEEMGDRLRAARKLGVEGGYPMCLSDLPQVQALRLDPSERVGGLPGAERLASTLVTLPVHRWVEGGHVQRVLTLLCRPKT